MWQLPAILGDEKALASVWIPAAMKDHGKVRQR